MRASFFEFAHVLSEKPVPTPDQVRGRLFPEHTPAKQNPRGRPRGFFDSMERSKAYFLAPMPANFFWKRDSRPPRSSNCCCPPVQAGCDFESISSCKLSPALPQVERVVYSVPSVIVTLIGW